MSTSASPSISGSGGTIGTCLTRPTIAWPGATWTTGLAACSWLTSPSSPAGLSTATTTSTPIGGALRTRIASRCSRRASGLPGGPSTRRRSSAAALACSTTRPRAARSTAPQTSIHTSAAATTSSRSASPRRSKRVTRSSQVSPPQEWRLLRPTRSWRSTSRPSRETPTCSSGRWACSASCSPAPRWSSTTSALTAPTC